jgi:hypothetical protein
MAVPSVSGSIRPASAVEPVTSQKITVTVLRTSDDAAPGAALSERGAPQNGQKANSSELSRPQDPQVITVSASVGERSSSTSTCDVPLYVPSVTS